MWGQLAAAGISALGGALGSGGQEKIHPMDAIPRFLRDDYKRLAGSVEGLATPEYWQGDMIAGQNPWLSGALGGMGGWGAGMGGDIMGNTLAAGNQALGGIGMGMDYLQNMAGGPGFQYDQGTFDQSFGNLTGGLQNIFDSGSQQMQNQFEWGDLKGLNMANALGGGQGTSGLFQNSALGQAMVDQNKMNFGSNLWQNAANRADANAMTGGLQNLQNQQNILGAFGNYGRLGADLLGRGYDMGLQNLGTAFDAGRYQLGYDQSLIDANMKKHAFEQQAPWTALQTKLGMIPGPGGMKPGTGMSPWEGAFQAAQPFLPGLANAAVDRWGGGGQGSWGYDPFLNTGDQPGDAGYIEF